MKVTLDNFRQYVPERIYYRGQDYFHSGAVTELSHKGNRWRTSVEGSEEYTVRIDIAPDGELSWYCDCPYDMGDMCKHVVAVLLSILDRGITGQPDDDDNDWDDNDYVDSDWNDEDDDWDDEDDEDDDDDDWDDEDDYDDEDNDTESATNDGELEKLLAVADVEALRGFLRNRAANYPTLRQALMTHLRALYMQPAQDRTDYKAMVKRALKACAKTWNSRYDYYNETDWLDIESTSHDLLDQATKLLAAGNARAAITIALQIADTLDDLVIEDGNELAYNDDVDINGVCDKAIDLLHEAIAHPSVDKALRDSTFASLRKLAASELENCCYADFGSLLEDLTASLLTGDEAISAVDKMIAEASDYHQDSYVLHKVDLLRQQGRHSDAEATIDQYIELPAVRERRLSELLEQKRYDEALKLLDDGIAVARGLGHAGTEHRWLEHKIKVYGFMGDDDSRIALAKRFFIDGSNCIANYHLLKSLVPAENWDDYLTGLLKSANNLYLHTHAEILIEEKRLDELFHLVCNPRTRNLETMRRYAHELRDTHSEQLLKIFDSEVRNYAVRNVGNKYYNVIADSLSCISGLEGGKPVAHTLAEHLRNTYPRRRNLMARIKRF